MLMRKKSESSGRRLHVVRKMAIDVINLLILMRALLSFALLLSNTVEENLAKQNITALCQEESGWVGVPSN